MKTVASAGGTIGTAQRVLMDAARQVVLKIEVDIDALTPVDPATLAARVTDPVLRRQFINGMMVLALADGIPAPVTTAAVSAFAEALGVETAELRELQRLTEHQMLLFRIDFMRRGHIADIMRNQLDQHGLLGLTRSVLGMQGLIEDKELAAKYLAWEKLPEDTLGNAVWRHYHVNGFTFPGERHGFSRRPASTTISPMCSDTTTPMSEARSRSHPSPPATSTSGRSMSCCSWC